MFKQSEKQIQKDFSYSLKDGIFWVFMNSIALTFIVPYLITLGANSFHIGMVQSFPFFITSFLSLIAYNILKRFNSRKQTIVTFITIQSCVWIPLAIVHFFFSNILSIWLIILLYTVIMGLAVSVHPIYMDWQRLLFPIKKMGSILGKRHLILDLISILPILISGILLDLFKREAALIGFSIIFISAGIFRFISSRYLNKMSQTEDKKEILKVSKEHSKISLFKSFKKNVINDKPFLKFLFYVIIVFLSIHLATSYVPYFLLATLNYTNTHYIIWRVLFIIGTVLSLSYWGFFIDKYNPIKTIQVSSLFLPLFLVIPAFFHHSFFLICISNFFGGVIFGGFNLGIINYLYKNIKTELIDHISYFTIIQSTIIFIGTLLGAYIINLATKYYGTEYQALVFLFTMTIFIRFLPFLYSLLLEPIKRRHLKHFKYVLFQKPVLHGLLLFTHISYENKKLLQELKFKEEISYFKKKIRKKRS